MMVQTNQAHPVFLLKCVSWWVFFFFSETLENLCKEYKSLEKSEEESTSNVESEIGTESTSNIEPEMDKGN